MAGLYSRVASRGFPVTVTDGLTGAGALASQGTWMPAQDLSQSAPGKYVTIPGYTPSEGPPPPQVPLLEGAFGLPGGVSGDLTPFTHAAPHPGHAGSYAPSADLYALHEESTLVHAQDFGSLAPRMNSPASEAEPEWSIERFANTGSNVLAPVHGQLQALGGYDATQGYGGGGSGPGGVNGHGFADTRKDYVRGAGSQPQAYVDPAERPFTVPQASGSFEPSDAVVGEPGAGSYWNGAGISYNLPSAYQPPAEPATLAQPLAAAPAVGGWW